MRHMTAGIAEADTGQHAGKHQWLARRYIVRLLHGALDICADQPDGLTAGYIAVGIGTLEHGSEFGLLGYWALCIGPRGE